MYRIAKQQLRPYGQAPTTSGHSHGPVPHRNTEISLDTLGSLTLSTSVEHRARSQQDRDADAVIAAETMRARELYPISEQQERQYGQAPVTSEHSHGPIPHLSTATSLETASRLYSSTKIEHPARFQQDRNTNVVVTPETLWAPELYPIDEQQDRLYAHGPAPTTSERSQGPVPHPNTAISHGTVGHLSPSTSVKHRVRFQRERDADIVITAEAMRASELHSITEQQNRLFVPALTTSEHSQGPAPYLNTVGHSSSTANVEYQVRPQRERYQQGIVQQDRRQQEALQQRHPHKAALTTTKHPQGTEARLTTATNPLVVSRRLSRRVSNVSSSDADDEEEIPVNFKPEAVRTLAPHLQDNLRKIEQESLQKAINNAERSARVASGNSFSHFNAASAPQAQQVDAFESYQEKGKAKLSYASITNPDQHPPSR